MSALTLNLRLTAAGRVDMRGILPEKLAGLSTDAIARLPLMLDGRARALGELFEVIRGDAAHLVIRAETDRLDNLGAEMAGGRITVEGPAGAYAGLDMRGGEIVLRGGAGDFAACGMKGGLLRIEGRVGDCLGAARSGERNGMSGGVVAVSGSVGARAGDRMRRGLILIRGNVGDYCGSRMLAGSIVVAGACGALPGFGLRRGSLILSRFPPSIPASFNDSGVVELSWLNLLRRHVEEILPGVAPDTARVRRYMGDLTFGGKGEILVPS